MVAIKTKATNRATGGKKQPMPPPMSIKAEIVDDYDRGGGLLKQIKPEPMDDYEQGHVPIKVEPPPPDSPDQSDDDDQENEEGEEEELERVENDGEKDADAALPINNAQTVDPNEVEDFYEWNDVFFWPSYPVEKIFQFPQWFRLSSPPKPSSTGVHSDVGFQTAFELPANRTVSHVTITSSDSTTSTAPISSASCHNIEFGLEPQAPAPLFSQRSAKRLAEVISQLPRVPMMTMDPLKDPKLPKIVRSFLGILAHHDQRSLPPYTLIRRYEEDGCNFHQDVSAELGPGSTIFSLSDASNGLLVVNNDDWFSINQPRLLELHSKLEKDQMLEKEALFSMIADCVSDLGGVADFAHVGDVYIAKFGRHVEADAGWTFGTNERAPSLLRRHGGEYFRVEQEERRWKISNIQKNVDEPSAKTSSTISATGDEMDFGEPAQPVVSSTSSSSRDRFSPRRVRCSKSVMPTLLRRKREENPLQGFWVDDRKDSEDVPEWMRPAPVESATTVSSDEHLGLTGPALPVVAEQKIPELPAFPSRFKIDEKKMFIDRIVHTMDSRKETSMAMARLNHVYQDDHKRAFYAEANTILGTDKPEKMKEKLAGERLEVVQQISGWVIQLRKIVMKPTRAMTVMTQRRGQFFGGRGKKKMSPLRNFNWKVNNRQNVSPVRGRNWNYENRRSRSRERSPHRHYRSRSRSHSRHNRHSKSPRRNHHSHSRDRERSRDRRSRSSTYDLHSIKHSRSPSRHHRSRSRSRDANRSFNDGSRHQKHSPARTRRRSHSRSRY